MTRVVPGAQTQCFANTATLGPRPAGSGAYKLIYAQTKSKINTRIAGSRKIIIEFSPELLRETDQAVEELAVNRSQLICSAVKMFLRRRRAQKLERDLAESPQANAGLDRRFMREFKHVDSDLEI